MNARVEMRLLEQAGALPILQRSMSSAPPATVEWFTEAEVTSTMSLRAAATHLESMLVALHEGHAESLPKIASSNPLKSMHVLASAEKEAPSVASSAG